MAKLLTNLLGKILPATKPDNSWREGVDMEAATLLPPQAPPKPPKPGGASVPGYWKQAVATKTRILSPAFEVANADLTKTYRNGATTLQTVADLSRVSPELAASQAAHIRVGIPEGYIAIARDPDGSFNRDATQLALQLLRQMNTMPDYVNGFSHIGSLRSVSESLARQCIQTGAMAMELVLDKARLPSQFSPVPVSQLFFYGDDKGTRPVQRIGGQEIDLDIATFFYVALDASVTNAYTESPLESAIQPVLASTTFLSDLRRLCGRHVYQRYDISIDEEKLRDRIPQEILNDNEKLSTYLNQTISEVESAINNLGVEEALVHFDFFQIRYIEGGDGTVPATFDTVRGIYDGKIATATKTSPSILGMGSTTNSIASTETLMFMMNCNGMIRIKLQEMYSKALTLAVRLFGMDVTVEFEFDDIELRPRSELEAYRAMKFERISNQLSYGFISDDEACLRLTGQLTPAGYTPKTGTMFKVAQASPAANPDSQTSGLGPNQPKNQAPQKAKGPAK